MNKINCNCKIYFKSSKCKCGLAPYRIPKGGTIYTHLSYGSIVGKYNIESQTLFKILEENEYSKYCALLEVADSKYFKLFFDIDMKDKYLQKYKLSEKEIYEMIEYVINATVKTLEEYIQSDILNYVYADKNKGYGVHLYFPYVVVDKEFVNAIVKEINKKIDAYTEFPSEIKEKIMDTSVYGKGLRLLGQIHEDSFYKINMEKSTMKDIPNGKYDQLMLTILKTSNSSLNFAPIKNILSNNANGNFEKDFGFIFDDPPPQQNADLTKGKAEAIQPTNILKPQENDTIEPYEYTDMRKLVCMLDSKRAEPYDEWNSVGMCLYNINKNCLDLFLLFSQKSKKYNESECIKKWSTYKTNSNGLKIGSLVSWIKKDSPDEYSQFIRNKRIERMITKYSINFSDSEISIGAIIGNPYNYTISIQCKICPISKKEHERNDMCYCELDNRGLILKCRNNECIGLIHPLEYVKCTSKEIADIFPALNFYDIETIQNPPDNSVFELTRGMCKTYPFFKNEKLNKLIANSLDGSTYNIAVCVFYISAEKFRYTPTKKWYVFINHIWTAHGAIDFLRSYISQEVLLCYKQAYEVLVKMDKTDEINTHIKNISKVMHGLTNTTTKNNIIVELSSLFVKYDIEFEERLDGNPFLIGFNNGIYDIEGHLFRDGKASDYVSMTCGYDFKPLYSDKHKKLEEMINDIFPIEDDRIYFMIYLSSALVAKNTHELFSVLHGKGRNGKSIILHLLKLTFGEYCNSVSSKFLSSPMPEPQSPCPMLMNIRKARLVLSSECESKDRLNMGFIKMITGNDEIEIRELFNNKMVPFKANFKILYACNEIPELDGDIDYAFAQRLRCINFPTTFSSNPKNGEKKIDYDLKNDVINMRNDFFLMLIEYYDMFKERGLNPTTNISSWTEKYKKSSDVYGSYLEENVVLYDSAEDKKMYRIFCEDLYFDFKKWFKRNNPGREIPNSAKFKRGISEKITIKKAIKIDVSIKSGIEGIRLKVDIEENDMDAIGENDDMD